MAFRASVREQDMSRAPAEALRDVRSRLICALLCAAALAADCGKRRESPTDPTPVPSGNNWESVQVVRQTSSAIVERVTYRSGGLRIFGRVCRPQRTGRYPMLVVAHGGFDGLDWNDNACEQSAANGFVVTESEYRGEGSSEGRIEVCLGEVDDVLAMTQVAMAQSYVDPARVGIAGGSHGGCITLRALQRGLPARIGASLAGVTDWTSAYRLWQRQIAAGGLDGAVAQTIVDTLRNATGGSPDEVPDEYARRSPLSHSSAGLPPLLHLTHGADDELVPVGDACRFAAAVGGVRAYYVLRSGATSVQPPTGCAEARLMWSAGGVPRGSWPESRYLIVYEGGGHGATRDMAPGMVEDFFSFLFTRFP